LSNAPPRADRTPVTESWRRRARDARLRVVLADGDDGRAIDAAGRLDAEGLAVPVLIGDPAAHRSPAVRAAAEVSPHNERINPDDPLHVAALMVAAGEADACVGGATRPTAEVVRAALWCIGPATGVETVSSCFLLVLPDGTPITFGDCGVVPEPDTGQLASIAIASAATHEALVGETARVAMLSYSTKGSAAGPAVERVRAATELVRRRAPSLAIDGELQFDAAWAGEVARSKAPDSEIAGRANVFVFPDLGSGNIAYKITERLGGARAYGPLLQGTAGVMHDLSRGCDADDIVTVALIAACQAAHAMSAESNQIVIPANFGAVCSQRIEAEARGGQP